MATAGWRMSRKLIGPSERPTRLSNPRTIAFPTMDHPSNGRPRVTRSARLALRYVFNRMDYPRAVRRVLGDRSLKVGLLGRRGGELRQGPFALSRHSPAPTDCVIRNRWRTDQDPNAGHLADSSRKAICWPYHEDGPQ